MSGNELTINQGQNNNDEWILSIVRKDPYVIDDSTIKLNHPVNIAGILGFIRNSGMPNAPIFANIINQTGPSQNPLKFSVHINHNDKVIGFIEETNNNTGMRSMYNLSNQFEQPLNVLTFRDLVMNMSGHNPYGQPRQQYRY